MNPPLLTGETVQAFGATEQFIVNAAGNIIGIVNKRASGRDLRLERVIDVAADFTLTANDDSTIYRVTTALTITIPAGLTPRPSVVIMPPASGNVSIAVSGGAQINGATTTLTRSRASNPAGVAVVPYVESDGYGVSGS